MDEFSGSFFSGLIKNISAGEFFGRFVEFFEVSGSFRDELFVNDEVFGVRSDLEGNNCTRVTVLSNISLETSRGRPRGRTMSDELTSA